MNKVIPHKFWITLLLFVFYSPILMSQTSLPDFEISGIDGKQYKISELCNNNKPTVIIFWATWCKPCIDELDNIADYYEEWKEELEFNLISVSIDDSRTSSNVKGFVNGRDWPFMVLKDDNQDIKRSMNVTDIPYYCLFDRDGKIVSRHSGYLPGDEEILFDKIVKLSNEK